MGTHTSTPSRRQRPCPRGYSPGLSAALTLSGCLLAALLSGCEDEAPRSVDLTPEPDLVAQVLDTAECPYQPVADVVEGEAAFAALMACHGLTVESVTCAAQDLWLAGPEFLDDVPNGRAEIGQPFVACDYRLPPGEQQVEVEGQARRVAPAGVVRLPLPPVRLGAVDARLSDELYPPSRCFGHLWAVKGVGPDGPFPESAAALEHAWRDTLACAEMPAERSDVACWGPAPVPGHAFSIFMCRVFAQTVAGDGHVFFSTANADWPGN